ncbi:MAG: hypothetical protein ISS57_17230 [Anaerolineales bacterium]|nr:hypothetical protein [Chloroflexota bacterium]MBL7164333.1 hypothetical protein [Anaerolineales bacterium]
MKEFYRAKFNELFSEFNRYLIEHPEFTGDIPEGGEVILLDKQDPGYNRYVLSQIRDVSPEHPVVYIEVGKLAPMRSRLRKPVVLSSAAAL